MRPASLLTPRTYRDIRIGTAQLQNVINANLPIEMTLNGVQMRLDSLLVDLSTPGRMAQTMVITAEASSWSTSATVIASGVPEYREGELYISDVTVASITLDTLRTPLTGVEPPRYLASLTTMLSNTRVGKGVESLVGDGRKFAENFLRSGTEDLIRALFSRIPIYRLDQSLSKEGVARMMIASIRIEDSALVISLKKKPLIIACISLGAACMTGAVAYGAIHLLHL